MSIKLSKDSYYSLESIQKSNEALNHEIGSIVEFPRDDDVIQCFDGLVKTSCGFVNITKNANKPHWKNVFSF